MNTRRTGKGWNDLAVRCTSTARSIRAGEVNATCPSTPAVARPALCCVTCRTLTSVFDQLRSIIFCRFLTAARSPAFDALMILHRSRRTSSSCTGHTIASQSRSSSSGPFTVTVSNLPLGSGGSGAFSFKGSPATRQPAFARWHQARYPASYPSPHRLERPATNGFGFLLPFGHRRSLLGRPVPATGFRLPHGRPTTTHPGVMDLTGFPRSARMRHDRVGCQLYPGSGGIHATVERPRSPPADSQRPAPYHPHHHDPTRGVAVTRHHHWFTHAHPFGLPLTCCRPVGAGALGLPSGLRTRPLLAAHARGGDRSRTLTEVTSSTSKSNLPSTKLLTTVRSDRGALLVLPPVGFPGPPPEPGVPITEHRALHKSRQGLVVSYTPAGHGVGMHVPR